MVVQVPKSDKRKRREATLEIRAKKVDIVKPQRRKGDVALWALLVSEVDAPPDEDPLCWKLLTTLEVTNFEQACEKVEWYSIRWGIEVFHRTLKSGCKVEERQLRDAEKIKRCLVIDLVIAWRIYYLTIQGRKTPDVSCDVFLEEAEWKTLACFKTLKAKTPMKPPTLGEATSMIAALGGYIGGKGKVPGPKVIGRGLIKLHYMALMFSMMQRIPYESELVILLEGCEYDGYD
jgi:hypothetical protein